MNSQLPSGIRGDLLHQILPKSVKKYGILGWKLIYALHYPMTVTKPTFTTLDILNPTPIQNFTVIRRSV